ncbi:Uncharacterized protein XB16_1120 [Leptospira santarosai]|uniref:Uncharacterized protein n=1 Tax=Leptospira santarosai TaxID=28183 RepID=A0A2P1QRA9_9LEPT|nr:Uncharacterized protein XB16_1120 [Leptospira santarosai]
MVEIGILSKDKEFAQTSTIFTLFLALIEVQSIFEITSEIFYSLGDSVCDVRICSSKRIFLK